MKKKMKNETVRIERGQVYFVRTDYSFGAELASGRPVVIISGEEHNDNLPTVVVACMSRTVRDWSYSVPVHTSDGSTSNVICNQLKTLDKSRLTDYKGKLMSAEMEQVDDAIRRVLSLPDREVEKIVEKEVEVNSDVHELRVELEMYKRLYEKAIERVIDLKFEKDTATPVVKPDSLPLFIPKERHEPQPEPIKVDVDVLKTQMGTIPSKKGRRKKHGLTAKSKPEEFVPYKTGDTANINTDDWWVIVANTGMGVLTAQQIVAYRNKHGKYADLVDLLNVPRFGAGCMDKFGRVLEV